MKENKMKSELLNPNAFPNTLVKEKFLHLENCFYANFECIMTENNIINILQFYDLIEFRDDGGIDIRNVKFWTAIMKNDILKIIVFDLESRRVLHRTHCTNDDKIPCDWILMAKDYLEEDDLLDFDFEATI